MRGVSAELQARLETGTTFMCRCWLLKRRDGTEFGFTDHDQDLSFDNIEFKAGSGLDTSVMEASTGLSVDNGQAVGALSDVGLTEAEIMGGKYDGAEVWQWQVDWQKSELRILLFRGFLGEIRRGKAAFEAELRGIAEVLNQPLGRSYLRECDRVLGDAKCRVDTDDPAFSAEVSVLDMTADREFSFSGLGGFPDGWFADGVIRWTSGANAGALSLIKLDNGGGLLETAEEIRLDVQIGDTAQVIAGCDKRGEMCRVKFDNFMNFRGFPHMPGEDWVTAHPASGEAHDGGSLVGGSNAG